MAVSGIFEPRPDSGRASNDYVGQFRSGEQRRGRPVSLEAFRVTTDSADVAESIEELFGGATSENDSDKEPLQVHTEAAKVEVEFISIDSGFAVFANNAFVRSCDGSVQTGGDDAGQPCPCAGLDLEGRKAFAGKGGCKPSIKATFRLRAAPDLGVFRFNSGAWSLLEAVQKAEAKVDAAREDDRTVLGHIAIEKVTTRDGRVLTLPRIVV